MTDVLFALLRLAGFVLVTWTLGASLSAGWARIERRLQPRLRARAYECTKIWAMTVPLHVARYLVGSQAVGCFQPAVLTATCKANGSGSPTD